MTAPTTAPTALSEQPWYAKGLAFSCTRCGRCCGGAPGNVWVTEDEIAALAQRLGMDVLAFRRRYTRVVRGRGVSLVEHPDHDCIFFVKGQGCSVYEDRPRQCRTWPFWRPNLRDQESWEEAAIGCPGINRGPVHSLEDITAQVSKDGLP